MSLVFSSSSLSLERRRRGRRRRELGAERMLKHTPANKTQSTALVLMASYFTIMDGNGWHKGSLFLHIGMAADQEPIHPMSDTWY